MRHGPLLHTLGDGVGDGRIERDRDELGRRLARSRDVAAWQSAMARLDGEEQLAREPVQTGRLTSPEVVAYLRSLPALWADSAQMGVKPWLWPCSPAPT